MRAVILKFRTTLERQIQMQDQMRERAMAMQVTKEFLTWPHDKSAGGQSQGPFLLAWVILCPGRIGYGGRILQVQHKHPSHFNLNLNVCEGQKSRLPSPPSSLSHLSSPTRPTLPMAPSSTGSSGSCSIGRQIAFPLSERSRRTF